MPAPSDTTNIRGKDEPVSSPFPSENPTFGPLHVGDVTDDDGKVIDNFFIEVNDSPAPADLIGPIDPAPLLIPRPATRLITGNMNLDTNWQPVQILPADPNRLQLRIRGMSLATTPGLNDYVLLGYDRGMVATPSGAAFKLRSGVGLDLDEHTGEVWIASQAGLAANLFEVNYLAVTEGPK